MGHREGNLGPHFNVEVRPLSVVPLDNHYREVRTIMSSLVRPETQSLFVVQSGVVAREDPEPIADWRWKTLSVCAARLSLLASAFGLSCRRATRHCALFFVFTSVR